MNLASLPVLNGEKLEPFSMKLIYASQEGEGKPFHKKSYRIERYTVLNAHLIRWICHRLYIADEDMHVSIAHGFWCDNKEAAGYFVHNSENVYPPLPYYMKAMHMATTHFEYVDAPLTFTELLPNQQTSFIENWANLTEAPSNDEWDTICTLYLVAKAVSMISAIHSSSDQTEEEHEGKEEEPDDEEPESKHPIP